MGLLFPFPPPPPCAVMAADKSNNAIQTGKSRRPVIRVTCSHNREFCISLFALLHVVGHNGPNKLDGLFRNIRIFYRATPDSPWRLHIWFNDAVSNNA